MPFYKLIGMRFHYMTFFYFVRVSWCYPECTETKYILFWIIMLSKVAKNTTFSQVFNGSLALPFIGGHLPKACTCWFIEGFNSGSILISTTKLASKCQTLALKRDFADSREHQSVRMLFAAFRTREKFSKFQQFLVQALQIALWAVWTYSNDEHARIIKSESNKRKNSRSLCLDTIWMILSFGQKMARLKSATEVSLLILVGRNVFNLFLSIRKLTKNLKNHRLKNR